MSKDGIRRFIPYKPNSHVQAFFNDLKKRRIAAPTEETVQLTAHPVRPGNDKKVRKRKNGTSNGSAVKRRRTTLAKDKSKPKQKKRKNIAKRKTIDKRFQRVTL